MKTPCRRVGLRRIPSASRSDPVSSSVNEPIVHNHGTPKSRTCQSTTAKYAPLTRRFSDAAVTSTETDTASPTAGVPKSFDQKTSSISTSLTKRPLDMTDTLQENSTRQGKTKMQRLALSPTVEELNSLRKRVAQKEGQLKELQQAQIICNKYQTEKLKNDIHHWLRACQEALQDFLSAVKGSGSEMSMENLLQHLGIPPSLVNFNLDSDDFN